MLFICVICMSSHADTARWWWCGRGAGLLAVNTCKLMLFLVDDAEVNVSLTQSGVL